ncbi:MAG: glycosyltransferase family 4 protein [Burkholderiales bacterium]|nr:glycosyltransferase family 4 protein [Burkholderiales bacterium]
MKLIYVVRRFGPVGGMERYVWETACEMRLLGHEVKVLCETCLAEPPHGMAVHTLGTSPARPRWKALWRFANKVAQWLEAHPHPGWLVHSHERLGCHHITTYHGQPFATVFEKHWSRWLSLRVAMQLYMEWRELARAQWIVPVSQLNRQQLAHYYPKFAHKLTQPIEPGVAGNAHRMPHSVPGDGGVIGFVGKEWQRKGLEFAVAVVERLRRWRPHLIFMVLGPVAAEVQPLFTHWQEGYELMGWALPDYARFDVLLHPAKAEPYGMVIAEAMAAQVPVVVSNHCGAAAHVKPDAGAVLALTDPVDAWAEAIEQQLGRHTLVPSFVRTWRQVAQAYETLYQATSGENVPSQSSGPCDRTDHGPAPVLHSRP